MLARILDSPIIDIILVILAVRFIFPQLFTVRIIKPEKKQERITIIQTDNPEKKTDKTSGEYVDFEEVK